MKHFKTIAVAVLLSAGMAAAHSGVKNAAVKARMDAMGGMGADMKTLGQMAKGATAFDANAARAAAASIAAHAAATPGLFQAEETDPKSEALPAIWTNFQDFTTKSTELETVALGLSSSISKPEDLGPALAALGQTCKSFHQAYRQ